MNDEHQRLIGLMQRLYEAQNAGASRGELARALADVADFTVAHFAHEEAYMASVGYPELDRHRRIHANLLRQLHEHTMAFGHGEDHLSEEFFVFLKLWLSAHIKGIDKRYGPHAHARSPARHP